MVCPVQRGCVYVGRRDRAASPRADRATGLRAAWWTASILRTRATGPRANGDGGSDGGGPAAVRGPASTAAATLRGATTPAGGVSAGCSRQVRPGAREPSRQHPADLDASPIRTVRVRAPETAPSTRAARVIRGQVGRRRRQLMTLIVGRALTDPYRTIDRLHRRRSPPHPCLEVEHRDLADHSQRLSKSRPDGARPIQPRRDRRKNASRPAPLRLEQDTSAPGQRTSRREHRPIDSFSAAHRGSSWDKIRTRETLCPHDGPPFETVPRLSQTG